MSTPSGKPSHSIVPDDPESNAQERTAAELEVAVSEYAPKRARQHPDTRLHSAPLLQVVVDWRRAKVASTTATHLAGTQTSQHPEVSRDDAVGKRCGVPVDEQQALDAVQQAVEAARKAINESPFDQRAANIIDEADLENLEASLRRLQRRHAATTRLPPAPKLPPVSGRVPPQSAAGDRRGNGTVEPFRISPHTLKPTQLMPPPTQSRRHPNMMLGVSIGCALLAGLIYYFLQTDRWSFSNTASRSEIAYVIPQPPSTMDENRWVQPDPSPTRSKTDQEPNTDQEKHAEVEKSARPIATAVVVAPQPETTAMPSPPTPAPSVTPDDAPAGKASRPLDPEVVALLIKQAEKYIATGDVVTARMIFRRAAEAGDATAALALAATYDPMMLAKLGVMGMGADLEKARAWYRMAESFGSVEAKQRLRSLDRQ
jgi:hypothetical protein